MKYVWKKCYKNFFERPYRSNRTKIHLAAALKIASFACLLHVDMNYSGEKNHNKNHWGNKHKSARL